MCVDFLHRLETERKGFSREIDYEYANIWEQQTKGVYNDGKILNITMRQTF